MKEFSCIEIIRYLKRKGVSISEEIQEKTINYFDPEYKKYVYWEITKLDDRRYQGLLKKDDYNRLRSMMLSRDKYYRYFNFGENYFCFNNIYFSFKKDCILNFFEENKKDDTDILIKTLEKADIFL